MPVAEPKRLIIRVGKDFTIPVYLPVNDQSRRHFDIVLKDMEVWTTREDRDRAASYLDWLPSTDAMLAEAERLNRAGVNWHDACALSLGYASCGCLACKDWESTYRMGRVI